MCVDNNYTLAENTWKKVKICFSECGQIYDAYFKILPM